MTSRSQRLELNWFNKDASLIPTESGKYDYTWVDRRDSRIAEVRPMIVDEVIAGERADKIQDQSYSARADIEPTTDNMMILGESADVLRHLTTDPEASKRYVGQVKLCYIDPPFNTGEIFDDYDDNIEHSVWLTLMRDRLVQIKKLLSADGSIWVHLDDKENHRMRVLLDEVFGGATS